jgi:DNA primase
MNLPPSFLDALRLRLSLAEIIGRKVKLVRKGREFSGLCPFHSEKSPSFYVNEEKEFFHCFGCGAHGDVIGFTMRAENIGFMEAIERLAAEAGMEVPQMRPQEREKREQEKTLHAVLEAACNFYQGQLQAGAGAEVRHYLAGRGLDKAAIDRFRLGFAPPGNALLKQHLLADFPLALIEEAGLARLPEDGRESFDYFRNRIMFPILDRKGRVIAFGGRVMGDAKPKYLNSPETPVFHKGHVLYGLSWARDGVGRGSQLVVTEGYMDVIALHRSGFEGAVAPLGTALTEAQLEELWRLAAEPILCFDGDAAGQRAASRAIDRALPMLKPGHSLRFATLGGGEDPDTLITKFGAGAMRALLDQAQPLVEVLWQRELAKGPVDTPERRADLGARLKAQARLIGHDDLQREYDREFRDRLYRLSRPPVTGRGPRRGEVSRFARKGVEAPPVPLSPLPTPELAARRRQEVLLRLILDCPWLLDEVLEEFASVELPANDLDHLRHAIIDIHSRVFPLDDKPLSHHLSLAGVDPAASGLNDRSLRMHTSLGDRATDQDYVRWRWRIAIDNLRRPSALPGEVAHAVRRFDERSNEQANAHLVALPWRVEKEIKDQDAFGDEAVGGLPDDQR